jgi:methionyl-tRNA synthetase
MATMTSNNTYYITTPIYYVNAQPHIGHIYTTVLADIIARYHRLCGHQTFFLTGTDEHAAKVADTAGENNMTAQQWADRNAEAFESAFTRLGMSNDDFIRTTQQRHITRVQQYVKALCDSGDVYLGEYEGWYDAGQEEYIPPSKAEEYDFKSPINGKPLVRKREKNYFFKLRSYREQLLDHIEKNPSFVQPNARRNEIIARIRDAEDIPISRTGTGDWGIKMPGDPDHSIYVWIDALFNYLTTIDTDQRREFWPCDVHLIAKEILWFHGAILPAMIIALGKCPGYQWVTLPRKIYAHSFWISEGKKMSKSLGNFIDLEKIDHYVQTFGLDALRYFLAVAGPLGATDADFAESRFIEVYNSDLANTFGNCTSRVTNMINRYFDGKLPAAAAPVEVDSSYRDVAQQAAQKYHEAMDQLQLDRAAAAAMDLVRSVDSYIEQTQPFKLAKDPQQMEQVGTILYNCAEALRIASLLLWPIIPGKTEQFWPRIGCGAYGETLADRGCGKLRDWLPWGGLKVCAAIEKADPLFPRYTP